MSAELISRTTRGLFRDLMTGSTLGAIGVAFQDEGFAPSPTCTYEESSSRRTLTQSYLEVVDWTDSTHLARALRVFERLLDDFDADLVGRIRFVSSLRRDGYVLDEDTGHLVPIGPRLPDIALKDLKDPSAIREHLDRIQRAVVDDPALAIGSAKELIESTAKVVLTERGLPVDDKDDVPALIRQAQQALNLHPSTVTPGPDGSEAVKKILGAVSGVAVGVAELRNRAGTGHGPAGTRTGLRPATPTSRSTPPSPGASLSSTPSPTPKHPGARAPDHRRRPSPRRPSKSPAGRTARPLATKARNSGP